MRELSFTKGHGARNDFVLFSDPDDRIALSDADVAFLCDRRSGIGADGTLRAVRAEHLAGWDGPGGLWFMDYRNADGSIAEMCGNGLRVFLRYLVAEGLADGEVITVGTRAGLRTGRFLPDGRIAVTMGPVTVDDAAVLVGIGDRIWHGIPVDVGNPHVVSAVTGGDELDSLDLTVPPLASPERFPHGVNAEFAVVLGPGAVRMRVHERGSGETCSCGTGVVAVAVVAGGATPGGAPVRVETPGGELEVSVDAGGEATLVGPAVLVARGVVDLEGVA